MKINQNNFIHMLKRHNEDAVRFLISTYGGLLKSVINHTLRCYPQDSEEVFYDVVMKIWNNIDSYNPKKSNFESWIAVIAKYSALDRLRKILKIQPCIDIDYIQIADHLKISDNALFNEFFADLIDCLNDTDKEIFIRVFFYDESIEDTAKALGKSREIVYNHISRGKKRILNNNPHLLSRRK